MLQLLISTVALVPLATHLPLRARQQQCVWAQLDAPDLDAELAPRAPRVYYRDFGDEDFACVDGNMQVKKIDEAVVQALVDERAVLRAARDYEAADAIKKRILDMGVTIVDTVGREAWYVTPRKLRAGAKQEAANTDHGYARTGGPSPNEAYLVVIDGMLAERLDAKFNGDFVRADELLAAMSALGVSVSDTLLQWRGDGEAFEDDRIASDGYSRSEGEGDCDALSVEDEQEILKLVAMRTAAKRRRDFESADQIRAKLLKEFAVLVDDRRRSWRRLEMSGGLIRTGPKVGAALPKIRQLLEERRSYMDQMAEAIDDCGNGDSFAFIIDKQLASMGVLIDEAAGTWSRPRRSAQERQLASEAKAKEAPKKPNWRSRGKAKALAAKAARKVGERGGVVPTGSKGASSSKVGAV